MSRFRIIALTALALLPASILLYASIRQLFERWFLKRVSFPYLPDDIVWPAVFVASTLGLMSTIWLAWRGTSMSRRQRVALAALALLPALMNIFLLGAMLYLRRITAFNVTAFIVALLSSISTIYLASRSERKPSLESVF
jgi:hypothetical protein